MIRRLPFLVLIVALMAFAQVADAQYKARPVISELSPPSGPPGSSVTIKGRNFGPEYTIEYNGVRLKPISTTDKKIVVKLPDNAVQGRFTLKGPVHKVTSPQVFWVVKTTATPIITSITPQTGAPGTVVTILGSSFSRKAHENTVSLNGVSVPIRSASASKIQVIIPVTATNGNFSVQVYNAGQTTFPQSFTVLAELKISSFSPLMGPPGTHVTLNGTGFATKKKGNTVTIGGSKCKIVSVSSNELVVAIPKKGAESGRFFIAVKGLGNFENPVVFPIVYPPEISTFSPVSGKSGIEVLLKGTNFGINPAKAQVLLTGHSCKIVAASANAIRVSIPQGAVSGKFKIIVPKMGTTESDNIFEVWAPLAVTRMDPTFGLPGTKVKLFGSGFRAKTSDHSLYMGKRKIKIDKMVGGALLFTIPKDSQDGPASFRLEVKDRGAALLAMSFTVMHVPKITGVSPSRGFIGQMVTIKGVYFGSNTSHVRVLLNGQVVPLAAVTPSQITLTVPPGATNGVFEVQTVRRGSVKTKKVFEVFVPVKVTNFIPSLGHSGQSIHVFGSGFDSKANKNIVTMNGVKLKVLEATATRLKVKLSKKVSSGSIKVEIAGKGLSETMQKFTVAEKIFVKSFDPINGIPGTHVKIKGKGFENTGLRGFIGTTPIGVRVDSPNQVTIAIPAGAEGGKFSFTAPGAGRSEASTKFKVLTPLEISGFQPAYGPRGTKVSIYGTGFDLRPNKTKVTYNNVVLNIEKGSTDTMLVVKIPKGTKDGPFKVKVRGRGNIESENLFSVVKPVVVPATPPPVAAVVAAPVVATPVVAAPVVAAPVTPTSTPSVQQPVQPIVAVPVKKPAKTAPVSMDDMLGIKGEQAKITGFDPTSAPVGELIMIDGVGFGEDMDVVKAWVGNVPATILGVLPDMLQIEVPAGVRRGTIKIKVGSNPIIKSKGLLKVTD